MAEQPFCRGVEGRALCSTCAAKLPPGSTPTGRAAKHEPWPFDPCPHYRQQEPQPYPADFARCIGRRWSEQEFLAPECQDCARWLAGYLDSHMGYAGAVRARIVPPRDEQCPMRRQIKSEA